MRMTCQIIAWVGAVRVGKRVGWPRMECCEAMRGDGARGQPHPAHDIHLKFPRPSLLEPRDADVRSRGEGGGGKRVFPLQNQALARVLCLARARGPQ